MNIPSTQSKAVFISVVSLVVLVAAYFSAIHLYRAYLAGTVIEDREDNWALHANFGGGPVEPEIVGLDIFGPHKENEKGKLFVTLTDRARVDRFQSVLREDSVTVDHAPAEALHIDLRHPDLTYDVVFKKKGGGAGGGWIFHYTADGREYIFTKPDDETGDYEYNPVIWEYVQKMAKPQP